MMYGLVEMTRDMTSLINAVTLTNLRSAQELLRADNPEAVAELQQRFIREYTDTLLQGTMTIVDAIKAASRP
jgi:poly(hydroxyalkanoate) depolymerase family esterase